MTDTAPNRPHSSGDSSSFGFRDVDAREKVKMVRGVFDSVASNYDLMNDLMSAGVHRLWKDAAAAKLNPRPGETILDVAGGTGDMARRYSKMARAAQARRGGEDASVIVLDYNAEMILAGVHKGGEPEMSWSVGDAMKLPLPGASVDAYSISFGIRNVAHIDKALSEARRVLKPGGRFLCRNSRGRRRGRCGALMTPGPSMPFRASDSGSPRIATAISTWWRASVAFLTRRLSRP